MPESVAGSSRGGSDAGSSAPPAELGTGMQPGQEDNEFGDDTRSIFTGAFGVLYTVSKGNAPCWQAVTFRLALEWLQLFLLLVSPQYGFNGLISISNKFWRVLSIIQLDQYIGDRGYTFFSLLLYLSAIIIVLFVALSIWIGYSFQHNRFDYKWPIAAVQWIAFLFCQVLDVTALTLFLLPLDCQLYSGNKAFRGYNVAFPDQRCFAMPHLVLIFVGIICLLAFVTLASFVKLGEVDLNPATKNLTAMAHSKVELYGFCIKVLMVLMATFLSNHQHMAIAQIILAALLLWIYGYWVPHYYNAINYIRTGIYTATLWTALSLILMAYAPSGGNLSDYQSTITTMMWAGQLPCFLAGAAASYFRLRFFRVTVINRFLVAPPGTKAKNIYRFSDAREVEIVGRVCRKWTEEDDDILEPAAIELAEMVMKAGIALLPNDPFMVVLYSSFLIEVQNSMQSGFTVLQTAKKLQPSLLTKFAIFNREQQHSLKASGSGSGPQSDLVSFVELERNYRLAKKVHRDALMAMRTFWSLLPHSSVQFETLSNAVANMDTTIRAAEKVYRSVLQRHANSVKLVRLYAKFLEMVKHDPWNASKWFAEADKLEQQAEDIKHSNVFGDLVVDDPAMRSYLTALGNARPGANVPAVVIMDAHAIIHMTNPVAADMFGYDLARNEMVGRSVNILIPPPFSEHHTTYVRNFIMTGKQSILNKQTEFVALHKERHVFPVQLTVSKISGIGEDTLMMGVMEHIKPDLDTASLWILENGQMLSVDEAYTDWFAFKPHEVVGGALSTFVPSTRDVSRILRAMAQHSHAATTAATSVINGNGRSVPAADQVSNTGPLARQTTSSLQTKEVRQASKMGYFSAEDGGKSAPRRLATAIFGQKNEAPAAVLGGGALQLPSLAPAKDQQRVAGVLFQHKYADASEVDVAITYGGIGAYKFFQLSLRRSPRQPPQPHMFVSDKKGRIMHITRGLSALLGSSPKVLMANDMQHAVEALLPQPFAQLHGRFQMSVPVTAPPPHSCRSGLSILLASASKTQPGVLPFRMRLQKRELSDMDEAYHLVTLESCPMERALAERRLMLTVDEAGTIHSVSDTPAAVFGFKPSALVGCSLAGIVDELGSNVEKAEDVQRILLTMATRALESPGISWRVTVQPPVDHGSVAGGFSAVKPSRVCPAMMTLAVKPSAALKSTQGISLRAEPGIPHGMVSSELLEDDTRLMLEVCLWRSDLVTGVVEIDSGGQITNDKELALYPPGLIFGTSNDEMRGSHIARYLPMLGGQSLHVLFDPNGLGGAAPPIATFEDHIKKRSNLKGMNEKATSRNDKAGPLHYVRVRHQGDGADVQLTVQAVRKESAHAAGALYLIVHAYQPTGGRADLCTFLEAGGLTGNKVAALPVPAVHNNYQVGAWVPRSASMPQTGSRRSSALQGVVMQAMQHRRSLERDGRRSSITLISVPPLDVSSSDAPAATALPTHSSEERLAANADPNAFSLEQLEDALHKSDTFNSPRSMPCLLDHPVVSSALESSAGGSARVPKADDSAADTPTMRKSVQFGAPSSQEFVKAWVASNASAVAPAPHQTSGFQSRLAVASPAPISGTDDNLPDAMYSDEEDTRASASDGGRMHGSDMGASEDPDGTGVGSDGEQNGRTGAGGASDSSLDEAGAVGVDSTDFRRGTRFKKLYRMLSSNQVQKDMSRFKLHTYVMVGSLVIVHVAIFATLHSFVTSQKSGVVDLNNAGSAARKAGEVYFETRALNLIYTRQFIPGLKGLESMADLEAARATLLQNAKAFREFHSLYYLGPSRHRRLPDTFGLGAIWDQPTLPVVDYRDIWFDPDPSQPGVNITVAVTPTNVTMSLWELGNAFCAAADIIYHNGNEYADTHADLTSWSEFKFILHNGPKALTNYYLQTLDAQVQLVLQGTTFLRLLHVLVMVMQGIVLSAGVLLYVWFISSMVARQRFNIYNTFMVLPQGLVRGLATKRVDLDGEDGEDDDDDGGLAKQADSAANPNVLTTSNLQQSSQAGDGGGGGNPNMDRKTSFIKLSIATTFKNPVRGADSDADAGMGAKVWGGMQRIASMFRTRVAPSGKRKLQKSMKATLLLAMPFLAWGLSIVIFSALANIQVQEISAPVATFNMVNFVMIRHKRNVHLVTELANNNDPAMSDVLRADVADHLPNLIHDYRTMLYGAAASPNDTSTHTRLATQGLAYAKGEGVHLLFYTTDCLCADKSFCSNESSPYYADTHGGIDRMMKRFIELVQTVISMKGMQPFLTGAEFAYAWTTKPDLTGGLATLERVYQASVANTFDQVITMHIIELVFSLLILLAYIIFLVRPFLYKTKNETRRLAELLSQLPPDIDVEGLLQQALNKPSGLLTKGPDIAADGPPMLKAAGSMQRFKDA